MRDCRKCMYFIGKLSTDPRWVWSHCRKGISNITIEYCQTCKYYATSYKEALEKAIERLKEKMKWMIPEKKCSYCGAEIK